MVVDRKVPILTSTQLRKGKPVLFKQRKTRAEGEDGIESIKKSQRRASLGVRKGCPFPKITTGAKKRGRGCTV